MKAIVQEGYGSPDALRLRLRFLRTVGVLCQLLCVMASEAAGQNGTRLGKPLPLEVDVSLRGHNSRAPINLSPGGEWIAHTIETADRIARDSISRRYSATGFPFAEGDARMEATISNAGAGDVVRLGSDSSSSWAPVWSPDGRYVAFYSDEGGTAGLWIFDLATRRRTRLPGLIVRPFFGFENAQWFSDSKRLIVKALPSGMSVADANAREPDSRGQARFPRVAPGEASVIVRRFDPGDVRDTTRAAGSPPGNRRWAEVDLAVVDRISGRVTRIRERTPIQWYSLSPDERYVAFTISKGGEQNSQQPNYDLVVHEVATGASRTLAENIRLAYGIEWSWSPDSRSIALISSGQLAAGEMVLYAIATGERRSFASDSLPSFDPGDGEYPPLWDRSGANLYAVGKGALYRVNVMSGRGARVAHIPGWQIRSMVWPAGRPTILTTAGGRTAWLVAREDSSRRSGIFAIDLATGKTRAVLQEPKSFFAVFSLTGDTTGQIAFVSTGQRQLEEVWVLDTRTGTTRQASRINQALDRYELGNARILEWRTADGKPLRGALLLPPGYRPGVRVPLVVWLYGGSMGSNFVNRFGLAGISTFNMHVLATRGYAVLFPDAPLRRGHPMTDMVRTLMPGVDAAIAQGYADPDRLAIMGQSYGSYSTLAVITQTPRFKAAVITAAVLHPDLVADYLRAVGYYERGQGNMEGSLWEHRDAYIANSPIFLFDKIQTPLLIGQGERDGNLGPAEAIFTALERLKKPIEYRLYEGEGHVITSRANVLDFWRRRLEFLAQRLNLAVDSTGAVLFDGDRARPAIAP